MWQIASGVAYNWSGAFYRPANWSDYWLIVSVQKYLANLFLGDRFDSQELKLKISNDVEKYCAQVEQGMEQRPLCSLLFSNPNDLLFDRVFQHKAGLILHMIAAKIGGDHLKSVLQQYLGQRRVCETNIFIGSFRRSAGISIKEFCACWVFGTGAPLLDCKFEYNKKENMLEMTIKQKPLVQDRMG